MFFPQNIKQKLINYTKHLPLSFMASFIYGFPARRLEFIGVTGTEGKTTTVNLIYHLLVKSNISSAEISTVSAKIGNDEIDTGLHVTSPEPFKLQKLLKRAARLGVKIMVLELTSHGLDQFRLWGIKYRAVILTNINREHLDYHKTIDNYCQAKLRGLQAGQTVFLNRDDNHFDYFFKALSDNKKILTYGIKNESDFRAVNIKMNFSGTKFDLVYGNVVYHVYSPLIGLYNVYNIVSALAVTGLFNIKIEDAVKNLTGFSLPEGRLQPVNNKLGLRIYIDFAHTPNAIKEILETLRELAPKKNRVIIVFGSAGQRDKGKRPMMGEEAAKYADIVILTADDPRDESVADINRQITPGCLKTGMTEISKDGSGKKGFILIDDRKKAIEKALNIAEKGDVIVICGKGHEKSMAIGDLEIPWSDFNITTELLKEKEAK